MRPRRQFARLWPLALTALLGALAAADPPAALKIGIYSGTFDPPHVGHEALVAAIKKKLGVDILYVIPNVTSDHKAGANSYEVRKDLSERAFGKIEGVKLPDEKIEKAFLQEDMTGVIKEIRTRYPGNTEYFQVMGDDSFERFLKATTRAEFSHTTVVVVPREGKVAVPPKVGNTPVKMLDTTGVEIPEVSSSKIRAQIKAGQKPELLSDAVWERIKSEKLYVPPPAGSCGAAVDGAIDALATGAVK